MHYSSIMGLARTILSSPSGYIVEAFGWSKFLFFPLFAGYHIMILFWMKAKFPPKIKNLTYNFYTHLNL